MYLCFIKDIRMFAIKKRFGIVNPDLQAYIKYAFAIEDEYEDRKWNYKIGKLFQSQTMERIECDKRKEKLRTKMSKYGLNIDKMDDPHIDEYVYEHDISLDICVTILLINHKKSVAKKRKNYDEAKSLMYT